MNYTKSKIIDDTGDMLIEFMPQDLDALIFSASQDIYWGFSDLSQAVFPLLASVSFSMTQLDFIRRRQIQPVRIYAKRQVAGSATIYLSFLGGNI